MNRRSAWNSLDEGAGGRPARPRGRPRRTGLHHYRQRPRTRGRAELSRITYHAGLTHFLFTHIVAEVCDALALVTITLGLSKRVGAGAAPLVAGALEHR